MKPKQYTIWAVRFTGWTFVNPVGDSVTVDLFKQYLWVLAFQPVNKGMKFLKKTYVVN